MRGATGWIGTGAGESAMMVGKRKLRFGYCVQPLLFI